MSLAVETITPRKLLTNAKTTLVEIDIAAGNETGNYFLCMPNLLFYNLFILMLIHHKNTGIMNIIDI